MDNAHELALTIESFDFVNECLVLQHDLRVELEIDEEQWSVRVRVWVGSPTADGDCYFASLSHHPKTPVQISTHFIGLKSGPSAAKAVSSAIHALRHDLKSGLSAGHNPHDDDTHWLVPNETF